MKTLLQYLFTGNTLTEEQAYTALKEIASGSQKDAQVAAFLAVYNMRIPTVDEITGFRKVMLDLATPIKLKYDNTVDIVGTGGDGKNTFNISTAAAFVCAGAGAKVVKSGNYGFTSISGASNIIEHLNIPFATTSQAINTQLEQSNISFIHAPVFHPAFKHIAPLRKDLQVKTIFNLIGPLVNVCDPKIAVIGVHNDLVGKLYKEVLSKTDKRFAVVHALDGYDEISLTGDTKIFTKKSTKLHTPQSFGFKQISQASLLGGNSIAENAKIFTDILSSKGTKEQNSVVLANAALAIMLYEQNSYNAALTMAEESLYGGKALNSLKALKNIK